jgi:hypothetical protein
MLAFSLGATACSGGGDDDVGSGGDTGVPGDASCSNGAFCAGAAKRAISPTQAHIDGNVEARFGLPKVQNINLGGFGINPLQDLPDPIGALGENLTTPAQVPVYVNRAGREENLFVRAFVLSQGHGVRVAFVTLDAIGAGNIIQKRVKEAIHAASCEIDA